MASNNTCPFFFFFGFFAQHNDFDSCMSLHISTVSLFCSMKFPCYKYIIMYLFHLPIDRYLVVSSLELLWIKTTVDVLIQDFLGTYALVYPRYTLRRGVAGPWGRHMFNFMGNCQTVFLGACTILNSHQQGVRVLTASILTCSWRSLKKLYAFWWVGSGIWVYWVGQKISLGFSIWSYGKPEQTFWPTQ